DLGDRLHIAYLGMDHGKAAGLGYWQVDRGVFELLTPREEVTGLTEERIERPLHPALTDDTLLTGPASPLEISAGTDPPVGHLLAQERRGPRWTAPEAKGRAGRRQRVTSREVFCELADLAAIPRSAYALEAEVDGAMCLLRTAGGYEVFVAADGAR